MHVRNEIKPRLLLYLFSAIFCCISLSVILPTNQESILSFEQEESVLQVYLMDEEHLLVPVALAQEQDKDSERQIEVMMQYLCNRQELEGFRGSVIFPGGMILEDDSEVKIYYGAADTVECLATASVDDLLGMIKPFRRS